MLHPPGHHAEETVRTVKRTVAGTKSRAAKRLARWAAGLMQQRLLTANPHDVRESHEIGAGLEVLNGARIPNEAAQTTGDESASKAEDEFEGDDEAHNAHLPSWKQECITDCKDCKEFGWTGSCYDCLRYCEGQHA